MIRGCVRLTGEHTKAPYVEETPSVLRSFRQAPRVQRSV
jgi:hypothetical protein